MVVVIRGLYEPFFGPCNDPRRSILDLLQEIEMNLAYSIQQTVVEVEPASDKRVRQTALGLCLWDHRHFTVHQHAKVSNCWRSFDDRVTNLDLDIRKGGDILFRTKYNEVSF